MVLNIATEQDRQNGQTRAIFDAVRRLAGRSHLVDRELRFSDSFSIRTESDRASVKELASQFQALPESQQKALPALLNGLGMLLAASGEFEDALRVFLQVRAQITDPQAQAGALVNAYLVSLEQRRWAEALAFLKEAASKDGDRFGPFPFDRLQPERILGASASSVDFLCHDAASKIPVLV